MAETDAEGRLYVVGSAAAAHLLIFSHELVRLRTLAKGGHHVALPAVWQRIAVLAEPQPVVEQSNEDGLNTSG